MFRSLILTFTTAQFFRTTNFNSMLIVLYYKFLRFFNAISFLMVFLISFSIAGVAGFLISPLPKRNEFFFFFSLPHSLDSNLNVY